MDEQRGDPAPEVVLRLAAGRGNFLAPHHVEAARRLARLFERACMRQRVTMSYDPARIGGARRGPQQGDLADSAVAARLSLNGLAARVPHDCWNLLADICCFDKGLQQIEAERGWPRRSAKLVLRIGLDHLVSIMGLSEKAEGGISAMSRSWLPQRPPMFVGTAD